MYLEKKINPVYSRFWAGDGKNSPVTIWNSKLQNRYWSNTEKLLSTVVPNPYSVNDIFMSRLINIFLMYECNVKQLNIVSGFQSDLDLQ